MTCNGETGHDRDEVTQRRVSSSTSDASSPLKFLSLVVPSINPSPVELVASAKKRGRLWRDDSWPRSLARAVRVAW